MEIYDLLPWVKSTSGLAKIFVMDGGLVNGIWKNGIVRLQPPGASHFEVPGFQRPCSAIINDEGFAVVADWLSSDKLEGMLVFLRPNGSISKKHKFNVNLGQLAMSPDGTLLFITTAASENEDAMLLCYTINEGNIVWSQCAPKPGAEITVLAAEQAITVGKPHRNCGSDYLLKLTFHGEVLERWPDSPYQAMDFAEADRSSGRKLEALHWYRIVCESDISGNWRANAYRAIGEIAEEYGQLTEALENYQKAMEQNPKVGLKRKIEALKKVGSS